MGDYRFRYAQRLEESDVPRLRFRRQWAILRHQDPFPDGWHSIELNCNLVLRHHPEAPTTGAIGSRALVIGTAVEPLGTTDDLAGKLRTESLMKESERVDLLRRLGGIYVFLWIEPHRVTVYTDPGAIMGVYFGAGRAASTPALLPDLEPDAAVTERYSFRGSDDWYPGDVVPFLGVSALFANHALDVETGDTRRFWPLAPPEPKSVDEVVATMAEILRGMVSGFVREGPCLFSLTGGRDSRVSLAAARPWVEELEFFTIRGPGIKACDVTIPSELADTLDLRHAFVDVESPPPWLRLVHGELCAGMQPTGATAVIGAARYLASDEYLHVSGTLGEITKSMFWPNRRPRSVQVSALAGEFVTRSELVLDAVRRWSETVPDTLPPPMVYNLMYLEQRGGRWVSVAELGSNLFYRPATPFSSRELFEQVCSAPVDAQYAGALLARVTEVLWSDTLEVPFCRSTPAFSTHLPKWLRVAVKKILA